MGENMTIKTLELIHELLKQESENADKEYEETLHEIKNAQFDPKCERMTILEEPDILKRAMEARERVRNALLEFERENFR